MIGDTRAMHEALAKFMVELDKIGTRYGLMPHSNGFVFYTGDVTLTITDREDRDSKQDDDRLKRLPIESAAAVDFLLDEANHHQSLGYHRRATLFRGVAGTLSRLAAVALPDRNAAEQKPAACPDCGDDESHDRGIGGNVCDRISCGCMSGWMPEGWTPEEEKQ